jgi:hypothetical protein
MKILKFFLPGVMLLCFAQNSFSAISYAVPGHESDSKPAAITAQQRLAMEQFVKLTPKEYGVIRGKKLSFFDRIAFKATQRKVKKHLLGNSEGFNAGGFFLGFLLGLIGVLCAYIFSKDRNFRKWAWYGWFGWLAILLIILLASNGSSGY